MSLAFRPSLFARLQIEEIRKAVGDARVLAAVSGGVDSTTATVLTHRAIGDRLRCVFIHTGFMRDYDFPTVKRALAQLGIRVRGVAAAKRFLAAVKGLEDAEEKRKAFRETFYQVLSEVAAEEGTEFLVQGTIAPDWIETVGGIKTQHNVLEQIGINPVERYGFHVIEPLAYLYKDQVRRLARYLGLPPEITKRQPFPGPGLLVRVVGKVTRTALAVERYANRVVEEELASVGAQQFFAATIPASFEPIDTEAIRRAFARTLRCKAEEVGCLVLKQPVTGVKGDVRAYAKLAIVWGGRYRPSIRALARATMRATAAEPRITRVLFLLKRRPGRYVVAIRAIRTRDFMTAQPANVPWSVLNQCAERILQDMRVSIIGYDITPKPPATIEYE